jgi:hypothetical protein
MNRAVRRLAQKWGPPVKWVVRRAIGIGVDKVVPDRIEMQAHRMSLRFERQEDRTKQMTAKEGQSE